MREIPSRSWLGCGAFGRFHSARLEGTKAFFLGTSPGQADQSKGHLGLGWGSEVLDPKLSVQCLCKFIHPQMILRIHAGRPQLPTKPHISVWAGLDDKI